jgi:hypothetical protein
MGSLSTLSANDIEILRDGILLDVNTPITQIPVGTDGSGPLFGNEIDKGVENRGTGDLGGMEGAGVKGQEDGVKNPLHDDVIILHYRKKINV